MKRAILAVALLCLSACLPQSPTQNENKNAPATFAGKDEVLMTIGKEKVIRRADGTIKLSADILSAIYKTNEVTADELLKGKSVEVTGTVATISKDIFNSMYSTFKPKSYTLPTVQCMFDDSQKDAVIKLIPDQKKTIKGICKGMTIGVILLRDSSVIE
jgi:hypothetical protein